MTGAWVASDLPFDEAMHSIAELARSGRRAEAADLCRRLLPREPNRPELLRFFGMLQLQAGQWHEAEHAFARALLIAPDDNQSTSGRIVALQQMRRYPEALEVVDSLLMRRPNDALAWNNRGNLLLETGRTDEALESYRRALALDRAYPEAWHNRGVAQLTRGDYAAAEADLTRALELNPDYVSALEHRAGLLLSSQRFAAAVRDFDRLVTLCPKHAAAWQGRGIALSLLNHHDESLANLSEALRLDPGNALSLYNRAMLLSAERRYEEAAHDLEELVRRDPDFPLALGVLLNVRLHICDWRDFERLREQVVRAIHAGKRLIHPFAHLLISDSPADELACARLQTSQSHPTSPIPLYRGQTYRHDRIRIAYLSADFRQHAIPFLIAGVLEQHDHSRFELCGISFGGTDDSEIRKRLEKACGRFLHVPDQPDRDIAQLVRDMEIDIAINLQGYTGFSRPGIFAQRPAPVQVNYLGFPGTMGADYMDYLIADRLLIPPDERRFYCEQVVYLPDTYQANDSRRRIAREPITRGDAGLPKDTFVFCCFNGNQKILPGIFDIWMRILGRVPNSVLWLLEDHPSTPGNLRNEANRRGIEPQRLIFAKREPPDRHLARLKLAHLVLDTLPYCAHTTASDALWAGTPVLTRPGNTFAGRVAASLLNAIGLPELITHSSEEYEVLACELAGNPRRLQEIKTKLARNREEMPLFDTARMTRNLESAYVRMWERHQRGEQPASFAVEPGLTAAP